MDGEEAETRKAKLKRFQLRTKCVDVTMAEVYLKDAGWDERVAEERWWEDERWSREHPLKGEQRKRGAVGVLFDGRERRR